MTKSEFDSKFNEKYSETIRALSDPDYLRARLENASNGNKKISTDALFIEAVMLSIEANKNFLRSVLTDILEFDD